MINQTQELVIKGILNFDNAQEVILTALKRHSQKNPGEIVNILNAMNMLVAENIRINQDKNDKCENALSYTITSLSKNIKNEFEFVNALSNCEILCPDGNTEGNSPAVKNYFASMLEYLKIHEKEYLDSDWAIGFGHNKYLHMILGSHINLVTEESQTINY